MNDYLKREIMEQSRHQFIYGYDNLDRSNFIKSLEFSYPIKVNYDIPMAIYMENYFLPDINNINNDVDKFTLMMINREYFNIAIVVNIIKKILNEKGLNLECSDVSDFLKKIRFISIDESSFTSLDDLLIELNISLEFYLLYFNCLLEGKSNLPNINDIKIPFVMSDMVVPKIKKLLNNNSYFGIIIDNKDNLSLNMIKAINSYISRRINGDLSMKVVCEPSEWLTYYDTNGMLVEATHDYGDVYLDNSFSNYTKSLIKKRLC